MSKDWERYLESEREAEPEAEPENGHIDAPQKLGGGKYLQVKIDSAAPYQIIAIPEWVTPKQARKWRNNQDMHPSFRNRNLSERTVERYKTDMSEGRWELTHQAVALSEDDVPLDGQHRIEALARLMGEIDGIWMLVARDVPYKIMPVIDDTFKRGFHHVRQMAGKSHANSGAAAIKLAAMHRIAMRASSPWQLTTFSARKNFSTSQLEKWEEYFNKFCKVDQAIHESYRLYPKVLLSATGAFYILLSRYIPEEEVVEFLDRVATGDNLDRGDARLVLRNSIWDRAAKKPGPSKEYSLCVLIKGFNSWAKGEKNRKSIVFRKGETIPRIEHERL